MGREQKRIEFMYGLFLVYGKKHFPGQSATRYRLLRRPAETLVGQGFYASFRCDCRAAVTLPQVQNSAHAPQEMDLPTAVMA